jgi:hypothetical protein
MLFDQADLGDGPPTRQRESPHWRTSHRSYDEIAYDPRRAIEVQIRDGPDAALLRIDPKPINDLTFQFS